MSYERRSAIDDLSEVFSALADPTRRAILARLAEGDANVGDLAAPFAISQPAISRHLKVLEDAGLISRHRQATQRYSHLEPDRLKDASDWLARYRAFWEERYTRLDDLLAVIQQDRQDRQDQPAPPSPPATTTATTTDPSDASREGDPS
ncbi:MAG: metalloregulator ArsR/SmtB family transcription factor [Thermomicrobiales bacterium]